MANSSSRTRWIAPTPKAPLQVLAEQLRKTDVWTRLVLCLTTMLVLWGVTSGWSPSFPYRIRQAPLHNLHARVAFESYDAVETNNARQRARATALVHYKNDQRALNELRQALIDRIFQLKDKEFSEIDPAVWEEFFEVTEDTPDIDYETEFEQFRNALKNDQALETVQLALETALLNFVKNGLLENLEHEFGDGSIQEIVVYPIGNLQDAHHVDVSSVRIAEIMDTLQQRLALSLENKEDVVDPQIVAARMFEWLKQRLPVTLTIDAAATEKSMLTAEQETPRQYKTYRPNQPLERASTSGEDSGVIAAGVPLSEADIQLLREEHTAYLAQLTFVQRVAYTFADWGMYCAAFSLLWGYLYFRDRALVDDLKQFATLLGLFVITIAMSWMLAINLDWRAEMVPMCMFVMTLAIAFHRELALLLGALAAMVFSISHGYGIFEFVILSATCSVASLLCSRIRSRTRLVYVGLISGSVALPTTLGVGLLTGQPMGGALFLDAVWFAGCAVLAGLFMTALLPFLEQWFKIETDISLLELSDANHPLLKQLVQRAPGTYNHSINVASIAEAAAEAIGANGLLCRVGAYFHDIGKMRKPEYFVENQVNEENKHDTLVPTMSTLVIVAHVKEGAEMARRNHLPQRIIEIIEQHHGTTLVEFFYDRATKQVADDDDASEVDEADFRYPGPKPMTREAGVMMLSDAVESASRALREPTPARLEQLIDGIVKKRLDDGQFDNCPLTLEQIHTIKDSLIKSLNAMYHARVKYPDQQPA